MLSEQLIYLMQFFKDILKRNRTLFFTVAELSPDVSLDDEDKKSGTKRKVYK